MPHRPGRHFLQIPGPTNVPDRVLRAMGRPTIDHRGPLPAGRQPCLSSRVQSARIASSARCEIQPLTACTGPGFTAFHRHLSINSGSTQQKHLTFQLSQNKRVICTLRKSNRE